MEAVKFSSTVTLSFSVHSLYWVVEGRVAKGAEVEREEEQLEIENLHLDLSVGCSGCCSREPFFYSCFFGPERPRSKAFDP